MRSFQVWPDGKTSTTIPTSGISASKGRRRKHSFGDGRKSNLRFSGTISWPIRRDRYQQQTATLMSPLIPGPEECTRLGVFRGVAADCERVRATRSNKANDTGVGHRRREIAGRRAWPAEAGIHGSDGDRIEGHRALDHGRAAKRNDGCAAEILVSGGRKAITFQA